MRERVKKLGKKWGEEGEVVTFIATLLYPGGGME